MSTLTKEQAKKEADELLDYFMNKLEQASEKGEEHIAQMLDAATFTLGSCIAIAVGHSAGIGPAMSQAIETLTDGIQAGMVAVGMDGTFIKIKRD